jgi:hypothetical protein
MLHFELISLAETFEPAAFARADGDSGKYPSLYLNTATNIIYAFGFFPSRPVTPMTVWPERLSVGEIELYVHMYRKSTVLVAF